MSTATEIDGWLDGLADSTEAYGQVAWELVWDAEGKTLWLQDSARIAALSG